MQILSQRDNRWGNIALGFSNTKIRDFGCTITSLAMILDTTPDVVNRELKRVQGFANGNLVIWAKITEAFPQLIFQRRVKVYDNADVKANLPCLVEVDFDGSPNTFGNHWVVFIGNKRLLDPWTGQDRPTSTYPILKGYAIYKKKIDSTIETTGQETTTSEIPTAPPEAVVETPPPTPAPEAEAPRAEVQPSIPVDPVSGSSGNGDSNDTSGSGSGELQPPNNNIDNKPFRISPTTIDVFVTQKIKAFWDMLVRFFLRH